MTTKKIRKNTSTSDLDPAALARFNLLKRQRENMNRALLKRRRQKSGQ